MSSRRRKTIQYTTALGDLLSAERPVFSLSQASWNPPTDIYESDGRLIIRIEVAGVNVETLTATAHGRRLIVRGSRSEPTGDSIQCYHQMEIRYGEFERVFEFPYTLDSDEIQADFDDGYLMIQIPTRPELAGGVTVQIVRPSDLRP